MYSIPKRLVLFLAFLLTANGVFCTAFADHDDSKKKYRHQKKERKHSERSGKRNTTTVNNPTYTENCGACHFAYPPGLLPSGSWDKILDGLSDHFGESVALDPESKRAISDHLRPNAAEFSSTEPAGKIMRSIGGQTPLRITEIPYIQRKHREINPDILKQESIGSLSNCTACHPTAENGVFDDDNVAIPGH